MGLGSYGCREIGRELYELMALVCICISLLCAAMPNTTNHATNAPSDLTSDVISVFQTKTSHDIPKARVQ